MSASRKGASKAPRAAKSLIRGETADERLTMIAIQVDHTMRLVEAMAALLIDVLVIARDRDKEASDASSDEAMLKAIEASLQRLDRTMHGERAA